VVHFGASRSCAATTRKVVVGLARTRQTPAIADRNDGNGLCVMQTTITMRSSGALLTRKFLKSSVVMEALGYTNRAAFWEFVRSAGVPHIRLNARRIIFEEAALMDWIGRRSSSAPLHRIRE
jgi:hypothetical protein